MYPGEQYITTIFELEYIEMLIQGNSRQIHFWLPTSTTRLKNSERSHNVACTVTGISHVLTEDIIKFWQFKYQPQNILHRDVLILNVSSKQPINTNNCKIL